VQHGRKDAIVFGGEETAEQERKKLNSFPLIPMRYYPNQTDDYMPPVMKTQVEYPSVIKVGTAHAGYGKMFLKNKSDFDDLKSVIMMSKDYYTAEPLVKFEYEYRIQKLGDKYRTFRRTSDNAWKSNWGDLKFEEFPIKEYQKKWIDECAKMYGGLDMCAMDVLRTADGEDIILELNDTACGLPFEFEPQDSVIIRDMVLERMNKLFCQ
jgi:glutathione synthase/RimK-type ligase-like ATP-grasp enzyme